MNPYGAALKGKKMDAGDAEVRREASIRTRTAGPTSRRSRPARCRAIPRAIRGKPPKQKPGKPIKPVKAGQVAITSCDGAGRASRDALLPVRLPPKRYNPWYRRLC